MPVRGLTERPNIPRLGKIRLGVKDEKRGFPKNVDYFVCPEEVQAIYGEEPKELRIVFLSDDLERAASQYYRAYNATSGLICRGDGYRADALLDGDVLTNNGGELSVDAWAHGTTQGRKATSNFVRQQVSCGGAGYDESPPCPMFAAKKCAVRSFMQFAIRDVPGLGVYQLDTGSVINIRNINGTIEMAKMMFGGVAGVPMILRRSVLEVAPDGIKKKVQGVELVVDTTYSLANLIELHRGSPAAALLPPVDETEVYEALEDEEALPALAAPAAASIPAITIEQSDGLKKLLRDVNSSWDEASSARAWGFLHRHFGHAFPKPGSTGSIVLSALNSTEAAQVRQYLQPDHEHLPQYDEDVSTMTCSECGVPMEALEEDKAPVAQASLIS